MSLIDWKGVTKGCLFVIEITDLKYTKRSSRYWRCKCECGRTRFVSSRNLRRHKFEKCSCTSNPRKIDLTGLKIGCYEVVRDSNLRTKCRSAVWLCRCECGLYRNITSKNIRRGHVAKSCICYTKMAEKNRGDFRRTKYKTPKFWDMRMKMVKKPLWEVELQWPGDRQTFMTYTYADTSLVARKDMEKEMNPHLVVGVRLKKALKQHIINPPR